MKHILDGEQNFQQNQSKESDEREEERNSENHVCKVLDGGERTLMTNQNKSYHGWLTLWIVGWFHYF